jgi:minor histocompatibility antigen H13
MDKVTDLIPTMEGDNATIQFIGWLAYKTWEEAESILMWLHLIFSALFPIYIGSHASLHRPSSAAPPEKKSGPGSDDDDEEDEPLIEGFTPGDAIMFPLLAGVTLSGLYYLIKWLKDPAMLNKILGWYFSLLGIFGVGKLAADALNVGTSFVFPSVWSSKGKTYHVDPLFSRQFTGSVGVRGQSALHREVAKDKTTPFPGWFSSMSLSKEYIQKLWTIRALFIDSWLFKGYIHGFMKIKSKIRFNDVIGFAFGLFIIVLYNVIGKEWWLTNIMAFGFCYGTLQLMSPTTFWTGVLILVGLFFYDIIMVFYT